MPHLTLKHTKNLKDTTNFIPFFELAHKILCDNINVKPAACTSMVMPHQQYLLGSGDQTAVFIHLEVLVKVGREASLLKHVSELLLNALKSYISSQAIENTKVSVNIHEAMYFSS